MKTLRLYEQDAYLDRFAARVLRCEQADNEWRIELDQTAFFPEGGGQPWDTGTLGEIPVHRVQIEGDSVIHYTEEPIPEGTETEGILNWRRRFDLMQQHSGEHIVSGLIHRAYGLDNVGFHLGAEVMTVDWNGILTREQLAEIEREANELVWQDQETEIFVPTPEELETLDYRSKKELTGEVRIVRIPGADTCACCGTHVRRTGEVGLIRILSVKRMREGIRCELVCGGRALRYTQRVEEQNHTVSVLLSAPAEDTAAAVRRLREENERLTAICARLERQRNEAAAASVRGKGNTLLFAEESAPQSLRRLAVALMEACGGCAAVLTPAESPNIWRYCLGRQESRAGDIQTLTGRWNRALHGRGGGKDNFAQGTVQGTRTEIEAAWERLLNEEE